MKTKQILIRVSEEEKQHLKKLVKKSGYKTISHFTRHRWRSVDADSNTLAEIVRVRDLTIRTRQALASATGNINQIARMYNIGKNPAELINWDIENREALKPMLYELIDSNKQLIDLCNKVLGRTK